jgi:superfamily II DNA or RNA helicase
MDIFKTHTQIIDDYATYIRSFLKISDDAILAKVEEELRQGKLWPQPLLQFNPAFKTFGDLEELAAKGVTLHAGIKHILNKGTKLYQHQVDAIRLGISGKDFIVTSGTGSGKSLTYIGTIFHHLLSNPTFDGTVAVVVYPMNALINSQHKEFEDYRKNYEENTGQPFPIRFGQYTGQEKPEVRQAMQANPPHILLTNYMMLELLLTRDRERDVRDSIYSNLRFLVFDELHTYRGRQGADVAMLIRRIRSRCANKIISIGTSATMVSGGTLIEQQQQVAQVATKLFGCAFEAGQVVNETLTRSIAPDATIPSKAVLAAAIATPIDTNGTASALRKNPVAVWLENRVALEVREGKLCRRKPFSLDEITVALLNDSGASQEASKVYIQKLLQWVSLINQRLRVAGERYTYLPFKLHQFISQTGSVYTTLDQDSTNRFITLEPGLFKKDDDSKKPIFQNLFSRASGHPVICVSKNGNKLEPREFKAKDMEENEDAHDGYLIIGTDIWNAETDMEWLPDAWMRRSKDNKLSPKKEYQRQFPQKLYFDNYGNCSEKTPFASGWWGWYMAAPLLFDPTSGTFYDSKTNENTKLTKLGSEARSTSTTITAFSILNQLADEGMKPEDQKLLSFTDNRQDAALQAGHFNDFVQVILLRASIRRAMESAPDKSLAWSTIGEAVFRALNIPFAEYANRNTDATSTIFPAERVKYERALQLYLFYRCVEDLRRSWRIILPNLEQCALLDVGYENLEANTGRDADWDDVPILDKLSPADRADFVRTVLDYYRLEYALDSDMLAESKLRQSEKELRQLLKYPWTFDRKEELREPRYLHLDPPKPGSRISSNSFGPGSSLGKYIRLYVEKRGMDVDLCGHNYRDFALRLMKKLEDADYLTSRAARSKDNEEIRIYRLRLHKVIWRLGDKETVRGEIVKQRSYKDNRVIRPNEFFQKIYLRDFALSKRLHGEDHTGQLNNDTRITREKLFRKGEISALFCSPTMELGIDIRNLSVVHMRNAPPNPANYAQRSGRAGRSGQAALVFTYCSGSSPHDRHYFNNTKELVAGSVMAPRLDLCNRELLASHLNAMAVSEIGLPGLENFGNARPSLLRFVTDDSEKMPLSPEVSAGLNLSPETRARLKAGFKRVVVDFEDELSRNAVSWYSDQWIDQQLLGLDNSLNISLNRWRQLVRSARSVLAVASDKIKTGLYTPGSGEYRKYDRQQKQASHQLGLLTNTLGVKSTDLSEFYPYRYLASEGFLPGYNFTRLPVRVFLPTGDGSTGEFVSRPRHIALREFGPLNIIYHSGQKYRVCQLVTQDAEGSLKSAKVSTRSGYYIPDEQLASEICPITGANLSDNANCERLIDLIEISESRTEETDRITCEEEERLSRGYDIEVYFTIDGGDMSRVRKATVNTSENTLLNLRYIPTARLVHVNYGWRSQPNMKGFPIGLISGDWRSSMPAPNSNIQEQFRLIKLFTTNLADALYIEPVQPLGLNPDGVITLQHALKRAIEVVFQVEPNEIGVFAVGKPDAPNILIYEASEGSLGILSLFVEDIAAFHKVIAKAIEICRFDDATYKAPASYDDLLSYYNQRDHKRIDRALIKDALEKLRVASITLPAGKNFSNYEEQYQSLLRTLDPSSSTERVFIEYLYKNGLRLPDTAQKRVEGIFCQPDFYYEPRIWIFCDGTPHDNVDVKADDEAKRQAIIARGDEVWVWHYREKLADKISARPDIFKKVR